MGIKSETTAIAPASTVGSTPDFAIELLNNMVVPAYVIDAQSRVMIWNRACERLTGVPASELLGTSNHWCAFYDHPRPTLADLVVQGRIEEINNLYDEHAVPGELRNGLAAENWCDMPRVKTRCYLAIDAAPIFDKVGKLVAAVGTMRDMTVQKEAQIALEQLATRDGLTGLANRRYFDDILRAEWRRNMRNSHPISLLMVDIDHFKVFNDTHGYLAGDECLKRVGNALLAEVRRGGDMVARYGGEEFVIILPNQTAEGAVVVAERMRKRVEALAKNWPAAGEVTVSIGVAAASDSLDPGPETLLAAAGVALYTAKKGGRNRTSTMSGSLP